MPRSQPESVAQAGQNPVARANTFIEQQVSYLGSLYGVNISELGFSSANEERQVKKGTPSHWVFVLDMLPQFCSAFGGDKTVSVDQLEMIEEHLGLLYYDLMNEGSAINKGKPPWSCGKNWMKHAVVYALTALFQKQSLMNESTHPSSRLKQAPMLKSSLTCNVEEKSEFLALTHLSLDNYINDCVTKKIKSKVLAAPAGLIGEIVPLLPVYSNGTDKKLWLDKTRQSIDLFVAQLSLFDAECLKLERELSRLEQHVLKNRADLNGDLKQSLVKFKKEMMQLTKRSAIETVKFMSGLVPCNSFVSNQAAIRCSMQSASKRFSSRVDKPQVSVLKENITKLALSIASVGLGVMAILIHNLMKYKKVFRPSTFSAHLTQCTEQRGIQLTHFFQNKASKARIEKSLVVPKSVPVY